MSACVRANPSGAADVVWGMRIDPARIRIENVPLPASERRYGDILINDGAEEGTRIRNGREYSVFDELGIWKTSPFSTFEVQLVMPNASAMQSLQDKFRENGCGLRIGGRFESSARRAAGALPANTLVRMSPLVRTATDLPPNRRVRYRAFLRSGPRLRMVRRFGGSLSPSRVRLTRRSISVVC
jgi:hypothetical protein